MTQWIDSPGPDDDPVVRVEDELVDADAEEGRPTDGPEQRAGGEPAKAHGDPLMNIEAEAAAGGAPEMDEELPPGSSS